MNKKYKNISQIQIFNNMAVLREQRNYKTKILKGSCQIMSRNLVNHEVNAMKAIHLMGKVKRRLQILLIFPQILKLFH